MSIEPTRDFGAQATAGRAAILSWPHGLSDPIDVEIGARIRMRGKSLGMSQARHGHHLGVTFQQLQKYESGANRVSGATVVRMRAALEIAVAQLLGESGEGLRRDPALWWIATDGALELARAFGENKDPKARNAIVTFARNMRREHSLERPTAR